VRRRATRALACAVVGIVVVCGLAIPASSTATASMTASTTAAGTPAPEFCRAFGDYYDAAFLVQFITAFAQALSKKAVDKTRTTFLLVLSPKFEKLTSEMATTASAPLRSAFRRQAAKFARGTKILRAAGLSQDQITALAEVPLHASTAAQENLLGKVNLSKKKLNAALVAFKKLDASVDPNQTFTTAQRNRLGTDAVACGVFPDPSVTCGSLLSASDLASTAGTGSSPQPSQGCWWKGADGPDGNPYGIAVDVDRGTLAYDRLVSQATGATPVPGVGDAAALLDGFTSFSDFSSCGHTIVVRAGNRTVTVALCPATGVADAPRLASLARTVLAKLPPS
jgi:hypothetical protein